MGRGSGQRFIDKAIMGRPVSSPLHDQGNQGQERGSVLALVDRIIEEHYWADFTVDSPVDLTLQAWHPASPLHLPRYSVLSTGCEAPDLEQASAAPTARGKLCRTLVVKRDDHPLGLRTFFGFLERHQYQGQRSRFSWRSCSGQTLNLEQLLDLDRPAICAWPGEPCTEKLIRKGGPTPPGADHGTGLCQPCAPQSIPLSLTPSITIAKTF